MCVRMLVHVQSRSLLLQQLPSAVTGVGGVHRGGQDSMDISADLTELGKTQMAGMYSCILDCHSYWLRTATCSLQICVAKLVPCMLRPVCPAVVCAGIKSVLDIPRTLEFLETQGVCVAAYRTGKTLYILQSLSACFSAAATAAAVVASAAAVAAATVNAVMVATG